MFHKITVTLDTGKTRMSVTYPYIGNLMECDAKWYPEECERVLKGVLKTTRIKFMKKLRESMPDMRVESENK